MWLYRFLKAFAVPLLKLYNRVEVFGRDRFHPNRHYLVVGNHISNLDPIYIAAFYPQFLHFMAKGELFRIPVVRWLITRLGAFPVNRQKTDIGALKAALRLLSEGKSVGIFPEGTRQKRFDEQAFKQGAAFLAIKSGVPVLPVAIFGTNRALPKGSLLVKPSKIRLIYGDPIEPGENVSLEELGVQIRKAIERLIAEGLEKGWSLYD